jgi:hypothetical protein
MRKWMQNKKPALEFESEFDGPSPLYTLIRLDTPLITLIGFDFCGGRAGATNPYSTDFGAIKWVRFLHLNEGESAQVIEMQFVI